MPISSARTVPSLRWNVKRSLTGLSMLVAVALGFGCSTSQDTEIAKNSVAGFHERYNDQAFSAIYADADPSFRRTGESEFAASMRGLRDQYGEVRGAAMTASKWQTGNVNFEGEMFSGTFVVMRYRTDFASGPATETFTWRVDAGRARLMGYVVDP